MRVRVPADQVARREHPGDAVTSFADDGGHARPTETFDGESADQFTQTATRLGYRLNRSLIYETGEAFKNLVTREIALAMMADLKAARRPGPPLDDAYLDADQLDDLPTSKHLIDGVLPRHSIAILRGRDNVLKTFVGMDWSLCLASGKPWQEHRADRTKVLFIAGEGGYGIGPRVRAWKFAWRTPIARESFTLRRGAVNVFKGGPAFEHLIGRVGRERYGLVVVDTLRTASGGADGNGSDMGVVIDNLIRIKDATDGGSVLVIAHTDKGDNDTRGFSGIEDDSDVVWHAKRDDRGGITLDLTKMKDGPDGTRINLFTQPALDSLVIVGGTMLDDTAQYDTDREFLAALRDTFADTGATIKQLTEVTGMSASTAYKVRGRLSRTGVIVVVRRGNSDLVYPAESTAIPRRE